jgi:hypothetical protein
MRDVQPQLRIVALLAASAFGGLVLWHLLGLQMNIKRAVNLLRDLEVRMGIPKEEAALYTPLRVHYPMIVLVAVTTLGCAFALICAWCRCGA